MTGLGYDVQGNVANKNGTLFTFDYGNRIRSSGGNGVPTSTYVYDGHGRRARDLTGEARYSFYDMSGRLAFTSDGRTNKYTGYVYLGGSLVATRESPHGGGTFTTKYQHTDALGSPVVVTDANRNIVERNEYEPYGKTLDASEDEVAYTGHVTDAATGLVYAQQRYYDPMIGRFLSVDPVTADGATGANFNRYWYGNNNPYRFTDPDGRLGDLCKSGGTPCDYHYIAGSNSGHPDEVLPPSNQPTLPPPEWMASASDDGNPFTVDDAERAKVDNLSKLLVEASEQQLFRRAFFSNMYGAVDAAELSADLANQTVIWGVADVKWYRALPGQHIPNPATSWINWYELQVNWSAYGANDLRWSAHQVVGHFFRRVRKEGRIERDD